MRSALIVLTSTWLVTALPPPHPDVLAVKREEEQLPFHLRSPALHNPNLQEVLPLSSQLHNGEKLVFDRESRTITRKEIYNILTHAGFLPRRSPHRQQELRRPPVQHHQYADPDDGFNALLQSQDILQYL